MNAKERKKMLKKGAIHGLIYLLISIPLTYILIKIIKLKYMIPFWGFLGIVGIAAIITDWHEGVEEKEKKPFVKVAQHITLISCIILLLMYFFFD